MKTTFALLGSLGLGLAAGTVFAGGSREHPEPSPEIVERVRSLNRDVAWHRSFDLAMAEGCSRDRLVMWIEMAGRLDGAT